jgi:trans-aconitate 2-methyltransferase
LTVAASYRWDPGQYVRYSEQRGRPFDELVRRIPVDSPDHVVDIGCGPGSLTVTLADRWPTARITGVDSSADMIATAASLAAPDRVEFIHADLREWRPDEPVDVIVGNAVLHWVPGHVDLLATLAGWLAPAGALGFQVPANFDEPSHVVIRDLCRSTRWQHRLGDAIDRAAVEAPATYLSALADLGLVPDVWQTTYLQLLPGDNAVLEWVKGTALRPALDALAGDTAATGRFLAECGAALLAAYPPGRHGTLYPFRRTFAVGRRPPL